MSWSLSQSGNNSSGSAVSSLSVTLGSNTPIGHEIAVAVSGPFDNGVTDTAGNTYTKTGTGNAVSWYTSPVTVAGTLTVTCHFSSPTTPNMRVEDWAVAGVVSVGGTQAASHTTNMAVPDNPVTWTAGKNALDLAAVILTSSGGTPTAGTGYTLEYGSDYGSGPYGLDVVYKANDTSGTASPSVNYTSTPSWGLIALVLIETPPSATLSGPTYAPAGVQSTAFTVALNVANASNVVVTPASNIPGDTFQAAPGGGNITTVTIPAGQLSVQFYCTPSGLGSRNISITTSPVVAYVDSPLAFAAVVTWNYWSVVQGFAAGLSTVGFTVYSASGAAAQTRQTAAVVAIGNGTYGAIVALPVSGAFAAIQWDDGGSPTNYAVDVPAVPYTQIVNSNVTQQAGVATSATARGGTANTITVAATDSTTSNIYNNQYLFLIGGTGAGQVGQVQSYNGGTQIATIFGSWVTTPDNTTVYQWGGLGTFNQPFKTNQPASFVMPLWDTLGNPYVQAASTITVTRELNGIGTANAAGTLTQIGATNRYYFAGAAADFNGASVALTFNGTGGGQTVQTAVWTGNTQP